ncbi:MAG: nicotinate phosphoribosyltransferase, partial [Anaerovoracaceae bacterium]
QAFADVIALADEIPPSGEDYPIVDPYSTKKYKKLNNFEARELLVPIFRKGQPVYTSPDVKEIRSYCLQNIADLWEEILRFENPHRYYVDLSVPLWDLKTRLLEAYA